MTLSERIDAFSLLGERLKNMPEDELLSLVSAARAHNTWFDEPNVRHAFKGIIKMLEKDALIEWTSKYDFLKPINKHKVGLVLAGNIPMVGFHDVLCVLISGQDLLVKLSSQDEVLMKFIFARLGEIEPRFLDQFEIVDMLKGMEAVIATGSDNSARYFEKYFSKFKNIIRQNRTSVAVLNGEETKEDLLELSKDILTYYGLGCRNVAKIYAPENYDFFNLMEALEVQGKEAVNNQKYVNNYDYNKSIYLVDKIDHLDNGAVITTKSENLVSPISVFYHENYSDEADLKSKISAHQDKIQCIVSKGAWYAGSFDLGEAQLPELWDYADGVDTMKFLLEL
ncbi:acyl-CoA reductase [Sediminitomix flava]|uniref:Acyl-CoA reductase LuxC n=1 Tax=Sediminitomix flava TaxID=379075 RepID=A0A315Z9M8_SEDFL|nr:acyl-CoA reductase [Sediminitomix flava]PWJ41982.1 acyl-CoA reductase LuxC [Sediminitomix flava]